MADVFGGLKRGLLMLSLPLIASCSSFKFSQSSLAYDPMYAHMTPPEQVVSHEPIRPSFTRSPLVPFSYVSAIWDSDFDGIKDLFDPLPHTYGPVIDMNGNGYIDPFDMEIAPFSSSFYLTGWYDFTPWFSPYYSSYYSPFSSSFYWYDYWRVPSYREPIIDRHHPPKKIITAPRQDRTIKRNSLEDRLQTTPSNRSRDQRPIDKVQQKKNYQRPVYKKEIPRAPVREYTPPSVPTRSTPTYRPTTRPAPVKKSTPVVQPVKQRSNRGN
ncbi:MAG: hypothetical protein KC535_06050 [Nanoarchaeota archaeon]|nr:hypothetical protein [Nanoarchaeota archaeon]